MLLEYEGSAIVLTCKGDLCAITADHRRKRLKQDVVVLNPFNVLPDYIGHLAHCGINPLDSLNPNLDAFGVDCDAQAESIVIAKDGERDPHFSESAQGAVSGAIMGAVKYAPRHKKNLVTVYQTVCGGGFRKFALDMVGRGDALLDGRLGRFAEASEDNKEMVSIVSSAITQFRFMGNRAIMHALSPSGGLRMLRWEDLRKRPTTVYVILPVEYLAACSRFLRLALTSAIMRLLAHTSGLPTMLVMDEFAALQHMAIVENTMALSAGLNLTMLPVIQSADQLKAIYGDRMHSFLSCAGCQLFLPPRDPVTARLISELCGQTEVIAQSRSVSIDRSTGEPNVNDSVSQFGRNLMLPDEVAALGADDMLIKVENLPDVIHAKRRPYYANRDYAGLWSPDPYHEGKKKQGGLLRRIFGS